MRNALTRSMTFRALLACALSFVARSALADTITFTQIPGAASADDMSPDGRWIVGTRTNASGGGTYLLDTFEGIMRVLPPEGRSAVAVSDDGNTVLGTLIDPADNAEVAAIWHASTNTWTSLGAPASAGDLCGSKSAGYELSADGNVAVGLAFANGCQGRGFRWTPQNGMAELSVMANGANRASVVSANGQVIGGFAQGNVSRTPVIWGASGAGLLLDPTANAVGEVMGMNPSGTIILGTWNNKASKWTNGYTVRTQLGNGSALPGWQGIPMGIANTGTVVGFDLLSGVRRAWIQPNGQGNLIDLTSWITSQGVSIPNNWTLEVAQAISSDGGRIIGHGLFSGGWMITISNQSGCSADIAPLGGDLVVNGADLGALLGAWGGTGGDLNGDGTTDGADLGILLGSWGACPAPLGACCVEGVCSLKTAAQCAEAGGSFVGNYTACSGFSCANNDTCAQAIDITSNYLTGQPVHGDNSEATPPKYGPGESDLPEGSPSCQWNENPGAVHNTVWFKFTAPESGAVMIDTCQSTPAPFSDSIVAVYSGTCGALTEVGCDEDGCPDSPAYYSSVTVTGMVPGQTYYVVVGNSGDWNGSWAGPFVLTITQF